MTTLERLREAHKNRCLTVTIGGVEVVLAPMNATDGLAIQAKFASIDQLAANDPRLMDFYCELVASSAVEPGTAVKALDCDEGRELFRGLPMTEQLELGFAAAEVNGFAREASKPAAKKNLRKRKS